VVVAAEVVVAVAVDLEAAAEVSAALVVQITVAGFSVRP